MDLQCFAVGGLFPELLARDGRWVMGGRLGVMSDHATGNLRYMRPVWPYLCDGGITPLTNG